MKPRWTEVAALIALFMFALVMAHGWPWPTGETADSPKITDWFTAFGTIGAAFVAVGVASFSHYRLHIENRHKAAVMKWMLARWSGSVKTGASILAEKLEDLARTPVGQPFPKTDVHLVSLATKMIEPRLMLGYTDRLHILGDQSGDCANMISLAWALSGHLAEIAPSLTVGRPDMEILFTCADQARDLHALATRVITSIGGPPSR